MTALNPEIVSLALGALFLPFVSFLICYAFPARYSWIAPILATLLLLGTAILTFLLFNRTWGQPPAGFQVSWFRSGNHSAEFNFQLNNSAVLMALSVVGISFLVHLFSVGYMAGEAEMPRYFGLLGLFTFAMVGLVLSGNLLLLFLFWELVGVTSYLLIGFWQQRPQAVAAATKAFIMNRVGDVGLLAGLILLWVHCETLNLEFLPVTSQSIDTSTMTLVGLLILIGVAGKSAQFPLFTWLPDAMEGPTPVSALIHAATMVAAGIFLVGRVHFLFTPVVLNIMAIMGATTATLGAVMALVHFDIKRILAYSTVSQLGWMVMAMGASDPAASQLHLMTHAFFKAGLFLSIGAILHSLQRVVIQRQTAIDIQDIRNLGGLLNKMPLVFICFTLCAGSLAGLPLLSGFLSKESILTGFKNPIFLLFGYALSFITVLYTFRLLWFIFFSEPSKSIEHQSLPVVPWVMRFPLIMLAALSTWVIVSPNPLDFRGWWHDGRGDQASDYDYTVAILSLVVGLSGMLIAYLHFRRQNKPSGGAEILRNNLGIDYAIHALVVRPVLLIARTSEIVDRKWIDGTLHSGIYLQVAIGHLLGWFDRKVVDGLVLSTGHIVKRVGNFTRTFVNGKIQSYILWASVIITIFMAWYLFK